MEIVVVHVKARVWETRVEKGLEDCLVGCGRVKGGETMQ